ncbi:hypothetical protein [Chromobacterium alticapitis]|uniref:Uncharacterized protein n=1 Tax=Chromobacterium alticapitis TaxID=2073169 RepID=A0A2S5DGM6_9NEIS|nr:hypothetical protein [Chromobacterium alticapitis]POZ62246.1 hypothetical protein C2I19_08740 [Chromobacterium alticapitis]
MTIGAVDSIHSFRFMPVSAPGVMAAQGAANPPAQIDSPRNQHQGSGGGIDFSRNVVSALQLTGFNVSGSSRMSGYSRVAGILGFDALAPSPSSQVQTALNTFINEMYRSVQAESLSSGGYAGQQDPSAGGSGDFQSNLQRLLQDVGSGVRNNATTRLTEAFKDLQQALGGSPAGAPSSEAALRSFMKNLMNLQNSQLASLQGSGSLVDTQS